MTPLPEVSAARSLRCVLAAASVTACLSSRVRSRICWAKKIALHGTPSQIAVFWKKGLRQVPCVLGEMCGLAG